MTDLSKLADEKLADALDALLVASCLVRDYDRNCPQPNQLLIDAFERHHQAGWKALTEWRALRAQSREG